MSDLEDVEPDETKNLLNLLETDTTGIGLNFTVLRRVLGELREVPLIENG